MNPRIGRAFALIWLVVVGVACGYLSLRLYDGLTFRTDLMALLPREEQNPALQRANDMVTESLSHRVLLLIGHPERAQARAAAATLSQVLTDSRLVNLSTDGFDKEHLRQMGAFYFPYRQGLLADADRRRLFDGKVDEIADRALAQVYGLVGLADAHLLQGDPFLLMPGFFGGLPLPLSKLSLDEGMLSCTDSGITWILVAGQLSGAPYALDVQKKLSGVLDPALDRLRVSRPGVETLRLGAVFFAQAGAKEAMGETSVIGIASTLGTILVVLAAYRALTPLWLSLLVIVTGVMVALAASLWIFGELHVGALLFGVSLIGVAVDYSLQYCTEIFGPDASPPALRLRRVFMGISLGTATTVIGYLTLFLAPFPGLHQIAAFSAVGLVAAWLTVVLWLPRLDRTAFPHHGHQTLAAAGGVFALWELPRYRSVRFTLLGLLLIASVIGLWCLHADDDVRRMQSLSPALVAEQDRMLKIIGSTGGSQFFLIQAANDETALQREESLVERLRLSVTAGDLKAFQAPAQYVPSVLRQQENRTLRHQSLDGAPTVGQFRRLNLSDPPPPSGDGDGPVLTLPAAMAPGTPLGFLSTFVLDGQGQGVVHVVTLDGPTHLDRLARAADGLDGVRFIDPTHDFSALLAKYRNRALILIVLSAALMTPLLVWRYGPRHGLRVMVPPLLAVLATPPLRSLGGAAFTFFDAMALVLVLSVGVDYAVFCAETGGARKPVTMLAVSLAACTALMSFGLLALSHVLAVHAFGSTMTIGILLAFLLAPLARGDDTKKGGGGGHWATFAERGSYAGIWFVKMLYMLVGRQGSRLFLWMPVTYFYLTEARRRGWSRAFLERAYAAAGTRAADRMGRPPPLYELRREIPRHLHRLAAPRAHRPHQRRERRRGSRRAKAGRGGVLLVSHLGNAELCRARLTELFGQEINVLLHTRHAVQYNRLLKNIRPEVTTRTIQVTEMGPETAIHLQARIEQGEWIAIAADRVPILSRNRVSRVPFLGRPAAFSQGPYILAALMGCPVHLMFCLRDEAGHTVTFEHFADKIDLPRRGRAEYLDALAGKYAARLEHYCLKAPLQWYNFFDIWAEDDV